MLKVANNMAKQKTTLQHYRNWQIGKNALYVAQWSTPFIPATVITAINWEEWFANQGWTMPFGFATLLVGIFVSILSFYKNDEDAEKKVSGLYQICFILAIFGVSFLLLANIMNQMGFFFLATAGGCLGGATANQVNKTKVKPRIAEYKELIDANFLDKKSQEKEQRRLQAESEGKQVVRIKIKE